MPRAARLVEHLLRDALDLAVRVSLRISRPLSNSSGVRMSMSQPVSRAARRTFWPRLPMARRELVVVDDDGGSPSSKQRLISCDLGGLEGVLDEDLAGLVPADDVDLFAVELVDDVLDALPRTPTQAPTASTGSRWRLTASLVR
jgi:hypothetical protein